MFFRNGTLIKGEGISYRQRKRNVVHNEKKEKKRMNDSRGCKKKSSQEKF